MEYALLDLKAGQDPHDLLLYYNQCPDLSSFIPVRLITVTDIVYAFNT